MHYCVWGDTNFIGVVNTNKYKSFVDEDWDFNMLRRHFKQEINQGNLLIFQMTQEGIERDWNIEVTINALIYEQECFRKSEGYITVTDGKLCLVEYTCLTMAAQFKEDKVPDENCSNYVINIESGIYKVDVIQFYDVDKDKYIGHIDKDMLLNFTRVSEFNQSDGDIIWCSY